MEFLNMILNEENIRTLVILIAIAYASFWQTNRLEKRLDEKMDKRFNEQNEKIDKKFDSFYQQLKTNDFAHLNNAIGELTFDREHINSRLDKS